MGFLKRKLGLESEGIKLVGADIAVNESVFFCGLASHHPELRPVELVRLVMHYYADILFNFCNVDPIMSESADELNLLMRKALASPIEPGCNVLVAAGINDALLVLEEMPLLKKCSVSATLYAGGDLRRLDNRRSMEWMIRREDMEAEASVFSVFVLLQAIVNALADDESTLFMMGACLTAMNEFYVNQGGYDKLDELVEVPNGVYLEAVERLT